MFALNHTSKFLSEQSSTELQQLIENAMSERKDVCQKKKKKTASDTITQNAARQEKREKVAHCTFFF